ncbi:MAG: hypothetical protein HY332_19705 [Chloroflexi bacterium]|nr:hypothetical protein [Chloroflexota bacterium]
MSVLTRATEALRELEEELAHQPSMAGDETSARLAERIRGVRRILSGDEVQWVGTTDAKRLLGLVSENTVKAWARTGRVRSGVQPNGRIQVLLDDVLRRREETEGLSAFGGEDLTEDELEELERDRPGTYPWEREQAARAG